MEEVQQQQQLSTNEVPGSNNKPPLTDTARGRLCWVYYCALVRFMLVCSQVNLHVNELVNNVH